MSVIEEVRGFNRFYTREIGLLAEHLPGGDLSLPEARVLYELAQGGGQTAAEIVRRLRMDKAHASRVLARLRGRGLVAAGSGAARGRQVPLALTEAGRTAFAGLDDGARRQMEAVLAPLDPAGRQRLAGAMREIRALLGGETAADSVALRPLAPGDLGWIAQRHARVYSREYGWDWTFEGLVCGILADWTERHDPARDDGWIAERGGRRIGSVLLGHDEAPGTARLRVLLVEAEARGLGLGQRLVRTCVARARALGQRRIVLSTYSVLTAARHIYQSAGFALTGEAPERAYGQDLVAQTWALDLGGG